jgi:acyl carrier protein
VREHLSTELEVPLDQISESTRVADDLDADSLDLYELVMELEDTYGISVSEEEAAASRRSPGRGLRRGAWAPPRQRRVPRGSAGSAAPAARRARRVGRPSPS